MLKSIVILLLGAPLTATAAHAAALSLEETFETYVQVIVHGDMPSKEKLRHHLRAFANSDSVEVTVNAIDALQLPKVAFNGTAMEPVASALEMRQKAMSCTITDITRETVHSTSQATVAYRCAFPDLSGFFSIYRDAQKRRADVGDDPEHAKALFAAFANALRDAPDHSHEGSTVFLQSAAGGHWMALDLPLLGTALLQQVLPFDAWNTRIEAEAVPVVTGVPTCDLMMAAQLRFFARHHPQSPFLGNGVLQRNLLKRVEGMSDAEATRDCQIVHERNRGLWNREKAD
ncbi:hypothetical protein E5C33_02810 [Stenotrophomonas maltophilia]|uniref:hypothetical protein n=1 Tax=Stenotrophomonas maltophilia TaxID=40324 RepID=UPI001075EA89|nr:hypothetical protein [Stenotrophomonas maltophilia]TFZ47281.1 hypothetical protein E5C33_02810 [Stenotrophomonas maltophilia]